MTVSGIEVEVVNTLDDLVVWELEWDRLLLRQTRPVPMSSYAWLSAFFEYRVPPDQSWLCLIAKKDGRLVGVLPLVGRECQQWGRGRSTLQTPYDSHTYSVDMVIDPELAPSVIPALFESLSIAIPGWRDFRLQRLAADSPSLTHTPNGLGSVGAIHELCDGESVLSVEGSFDAYLQGLGRNFRRALKKAHRRLDAQSHVSFTRQSNGQLGEAFEKFVEVEKRSWRTCKGTSLAAIPDLLKSHQLMAGKMEGKGWLEFYFLEIDRVAVAAQLAFRMGSNLIMKKISYREDYSRISPGNMLFEWVLRRAFADPKIELVNCLTDMPWHRSWNMQLRDNSHLWIFNKEVLPLVVGYFPKRIKQLAHLIPGLAPLYRLLRDRPA